MYRKSFVPIPGTGTRRDAVPKYDGTQLSNRVESGRPQGRKSESWLAAYTPTHVGVLNVSVHVTVPKTEPSALFLNITLFTFSFKTNTFGRAYSNGAAKSRCRAMHVGAVGAVTWQQPGR